MDLRRFLLASVAEALATPLVAEAQQAAKALGLTVPHALLARADQVIE